MNRPQRRSIRLPEYDYAQIGAYFVTLCVRNRECLLGSIVDGEMQPSDYGQIVSACWSEIPRHFPHVELDAFVVMPNHVHGILIIKDNPVRATHASPEQEHASPEQEHASPEQEHASPEQEHASPEQEHASPEQEHASPEQEHASPEQNDAPPAQDDASPAQEGPRSPQLKSGSLGAIVGSFKSAVTKRVNELRGTPGAPFWLRNYYEHVVRSEPDLNRIRQYIIDNPQRWRKDDFYS